MLLVRRHAERWDRIVERGRPESGKDAAAFEKDGKILAVVCRGDDTRGLQIGSHASGDAALVAKTFASDEPPRAKRA